MAQIDFSNAVLEPLTGDLKLPMQGDYVSLLNNLPFYPSCRNHTCTVLEYTATKRVVVFTGEIMASGTEIGIGSDQSIAASAWKISNISFSAGDTYSFKITAEVSV